MGTYHCIFWVAGQTFPLTQKNNVNLVLNTVAAKHQQFGRVNEGQDIVQGGKTLKK